MQKDGFQELSELASIIRNAAAGLLSDLYGIRIGPEAVKLPSAPGCVSVPIKARSGIEPDPVFVKTSPEWNKRLSCGIPIFSDAESKNGCILFSIADELLKEYAKLYLDCVGFVRTAEWIAIPKEGIPADEEAALYAAALLLDRGRSGKAYKPCAVVRDALLRCLLLSDPDSKLPPRDAVASAVRASLTACESGAAGGPEALAMAAMLTMAAKSLQ